MAHRTDDAHEHIRDAKHVVDDFRQHQSVNALESIRDGRYKADQPVHVAPEGEVFDKNKPEVIVAALKRSMVVPLIVSLPCDTHAAAPGELCFHSASGVRGVCGPREQAWRLANLNRGLVRS